MSVFFNEGTDVIPPGDWVCQDLEIVELIHWCVVLVLILEGENRFIYFLSLEVVALFFII